MISILKLIDIMKDTTVFLQTMTGVLRIRKERKVDLLDPYSGFQQDDEELCLCWTQNPFVKLDIGFRGDGTYSYWGKNLRTGEEFTADDVPLHHQLPDELLYLLIVEETSNDDNSSTKESVC